MSGAVPNWHRASIPPWRLAKSCCRWSLDASFRGQLKTFRPGKKDKRMFHHLWVFLQPWARHCSKYVGYISDQNRQKSKSMHFFSLHSVKKKNQERKWEHLSIVKHLMKRWIGQCIDILLCQKSYWLKKTRGGNIIKAQNVEKRFW